MMQIAIPTPEKKYFKMIISCVSENVVQKNS